jgi:alpha-beta hydrolase superfamily lysophospholipase
MKYRAGGVAVSVLMTILVPAARAGASESCRPVSIPVRLAAGLPADQRVAGRLCAPPGSGSQPLQVLMAGATYGREYWDFGFDPTAYSFVRSMDGQGLATLNVDRLGIGGSSHPPSGWLTVDSEAFVLDQLVDAARRGDLGRPWRRVVTTGHSTGSAIAAIHAARFGDVDGVVLTGWLHSPRQSIAHAALTFYPADLDGRFRGRGYDAGYVTTRPATRGVSFYNLATADPAVVARDEATKETMTGAEGASVLGKLYGESALGASLDRVTAPVLIGAGQQDGFFCGPPDGMDCTTPAAVVRAERRHYPNAARFDAVVGSGGGHDLNLHPGAMEVFAAIGRWVRGLNEGKTGVTR